jgi:hypothetical protein
VSVIGVYTDANIVMGMNEYNNPLFATMFQRCTHSLLHAQQDALTHNNIFFFFFMKNPVYLQSVRIHSANGR